MYVGRFRTVLFPPLDLDFALHSQIIIFTIIALPLDVVYLTYPFILSLLSEATRPDGGVFIARRVDKAQVFYVLRARVS